MDSLKERVRFAVEMARWARLSDRPYDTAFWLARAGELRRSAFYVYGRAS